MHLFHNPATAFSATLTETPEHLLQEWTSVIFANTGSALKRPLEASRNNTTNWPEKGLEKYSKQRRRRRGSPDFAIGFLVSSVIRVSCCACLACDSSSAQLIGAIQRVDGPERTSVLDQAVGWRPLRLLLQLL